jgi:hypothetical protein
VLLVPPTCGAPGVATRGNCGSHPSLVPCVSLLHHRGHCEESPSAPQTALGAQRIFGSNPHDFGVAALFAVLCVCAQQKSTHHALVLSCLAAALVVALRIPYPPASSTSLCICARQPPGLLGIIRRSSQHLAHPKARVRVCEGNFILDNTSTFSFPSSVSERARHDSRTRAQILDSTAIRPHIRFRRRKPRLHFSFRDISISKGRRTREDFSCS